MGEENLWGKLPIEEKIETPVSILRSQAVALNKATKGLLDARVAPMKAEGELCFEFRIVVPSLGNYSATILEIRHEMALYPVSIFADGIGGYAAADGNQFKEVLKTILQSELVRRTITGLMAQARDSVAAK